MISRNAIVSVLIIGVMSLILFSVGMLIIRQSNIPKIENQLRVETITISSDNLASQEYVPFINKDKAIEFLYPSHWEQQRSKDNPLSVLGLTSPSLSFGESGTENLVFVEVANSNSLDNIESTTCTTLNSLCNTISINNKKAISMNLPGEEKPSKIIFMTNKGSLFIMYFHENINATIEEQIINSIKLP